MSEKGSNAFRLCPRCSGTKLRPINIKEARNIEVDVCDKCGGVFYDYGELVNFFGSYFNYSNIMKNMQPVSSDLLCPACQLQMQGLYRKDVNLTIDHCPTCKGFWLDKGELETLLSLEKQFVRKKMFTRPRAIVKTQSLSAKTQRDIAEVVERLEEQKRTICPACKSNLTLKETDFGSKINCPVCAADIFISKYSGKPILIRRSQSRSFDVPLRRKISIGIGKISKEIDSDSALALYRNFDYDYHNLNDSATLGTYLFCLLTQLPVEVSNPLKREPLFLYFLIGVNFILFILQVSYRRGPLDVLTLKWGLSPDTISATYMFSFLTHMYLHANIYHIIGNMFTLWIFGDNVLDVFMDHGFLKGSLLFFAFYTICGLIGGLCYVINAKPISTQIQDILARYFSLNLKYKTAIGASGAISGIMAAYWRMFPKSRIYHVIFFIPFKFPLYLHFGIYIFWNLLLIGKNSGIAWEAHLGGFIAGYFLIPYFLPYSLKKLRNEE